MRRLRRAAEVAPSERRPRAVRPAWLLALALLAATPLDANADAACTSEPSLSALDFWLGHWNVCVDGTLAGVDRVERVLGGCAVREEWQASGDAQRGLGLFYFVAAEKEWKQVWVTDQALRPGGLKEKRLVARYADGGLRFQGEIALEDGRRILDRTTLRPLPDGRVAQRIEISRDGGEHWQPSFVAEYRPAARAQAASPADACR